MHVMYVLLGVCINKNPMWLVSHVQEVFKHYEPIIDLCDIASYNQITLIFTIYI